ncbi:MAG: RNA polymerase sporulation sigma factor SigG [Clostridia bacterium]|nr:RNA polymerase sporulation sigma factor SigG [Clostridia bacterium]
MYNKVELTGVNTSKLPVLTEEEKRELLVKIRQGDMNAREKFINGNLKLVLSVIQKFSNRGKSADDLFQVGCIGLIKSVDNFDISLDVRFSTYAVPMIIGEIRRYLRDNNAIRVSRSVRDIAYRALSAKEQLMRTAGKEPTVQELARAVGVTPEEITDALDAIADPISLNEPISGNNEENLCVMDAIRDESSTDSNWIDELTLKETIKKLSDREKKIIAMRFFIGRTQTEVAKEIGISQAQVSRLEKGALDKIKKEL